jgi:hypothetical protein
MPYPPSHHAGQEEALRRAEDAADERADLECLVDRACEHASLPFTHPAIHRLARRERAHRAGPGEEAPS